MDGFDEKGIRTEKMPQENKSDPVIMNYKS